MKISIQKIRLLPALTFKCSNCNCEVYKCDGKGCRVKFNDSDNVYCKKTEWEEEESHLIDIGGGLHFCEKCIKKMKLQ